MKQIITFFIFAVVLMFRYSVQGQASTSPTRTIHVFVALCDNKYQGIVPVPAKIGNGQDADNNLYWGCAFGVRSYFKNSKYWKLVKTYKFSGKLKERVIFRHIMKDVYLVADAYDGQYIKQCTVDFLNSCAGSQKDTIHVDKRVIGIYGNASLLNYTGHDGLMDFTLDNNFANTDGKVRDCIVLACYSRKYFSPHLVATKARPLVWSTGLMSPEAYTLHDAIEAYLSNGNNENVHTAAARAYSKYQHCSEKAARNLLVSGW